MLRYRAVDQKEALANLEMNVRQRFEEEGLEEARFQAFGVDAVEGKLVTRTNLDVPESFTLMQRSRVMEIAGEECSRLIQERYGAV
jgi:hypothetical protein